MPIHHTANVHILEECDQSEGVWAWLPPYWCSCINVFTTCNLLLCVCVLILPRWGCNIKKISTNNISFSMLSDVISPCKAWELRCQAGPYGKCPERRNWFSCFTQVWHLAENHSYSQMVWCVSWGLCKPLQRWYHWCWWQMRCGMQLGYILIHICY